MRIYSRLGMWALLAVALCGGAGRVVAQEPTFTAQVDKNPVSQGDQFTLSLTLAGPGRIGGKNLKLPDLGRFFIMAGPNQSSSMQVINGQVSASVTYTYVLQPRETGTITIGPASIDVDGTVLTSAPIALEVVKGQPAPRQTQQSGAPADAAQQIGDNLFLRAIVDRSRVMQGEQVNLTFKLYTRVSVANYAVEKNPTMTGFWAEDIEIPKNITLTNETINGKQYRAGVIKRQALFPTRSGELQVEPMEVQATVQIQQRSADPFDAFFRDPFGRNVNHAVKSNAVRIDVDPLPPGAPAEFGGAVGQFAMSATVDKRTTRTNEPVSLKITLSGTGNIKLLESPTPELPPDFEQYPPKVTDMINRGQGKISGSKTFEYLVIPRYPGLKVIKPLSFVYFDPVKKEYVRLRSPQLELNVEQGVTPPGASAGSVAREDIQILSQDIRFIKVGSAALMRRGAALHARPEFLVLLLLPLLGLAGAAVFARRRHVDMADAAAYRTRRAIKVAQRGLREAEYLLKEKSGPKGQPSSAQRLRFYGEVSRAVTKYLSDKLGIPHAEMSTETVAAALKQRSVDAGIVHSLKSLLESCDLARFAPTGLDLASMRKTYDEARRIIVELERTLKS